MADYDRLGALSRMMEDMPPPAEGAEGVEGAGPEVPDTLDDVLAALEDIAPTVAPDQQENFQQALDLLRQVAAAKPAEGRMTEGEPEEGVVPPAVEVGL